MTIAERPVRTRRRAPARRNVLAEIAERRRADLAGADLRPDGDPGPPRPVVERLAAPGLHLIAELKRRSPSAGAIATATILRRQRVGHRSPRATAP